MDGILRVLVQCFPVGIRHRKEVGKNNRVYTRDTARVMLFRVRCRVNLIRRVCQRGLRHRRIALAALVEGGDLCLLESESLIPGDSASQRPGSAHRDPEPEQAAADVHGCRTVTSASWPASIFAASFSISGSRWP